MLQNKYVLSTKPIQQTSGSTFVKCLYLTKQNTNMTLTISQLQEYIQALRKMNDLLCQKNPKSIQILINQLTQQNKSLEKSLFRQIKHSQQLSCELLMKSQLLSQNQNQYKQILQNYQQKIYELRILLQNKEVVISSFQQIKEECLKQEACMTSKSNMIEFDEVQLLKNIVDRYKLENQELKAINELKQEQLAQKKQEIRKIEKIIDMNKQWQTYKKMLSDESKHQKTKSLKKVDARLNLQQQLTRYDIKYIKHRNEAFTKSSIANQINNFKLILIKLNMQLRKERQDRVKMVKEMSRKVKECKILREKYERNKKDLYANMIQLEFYRNNFRELNKISKQQKIKYFKENYNEIIPQIQKQKQKKALISYWKYWHKTHLNQTHHEKCFISKKDIFNKIETSRNNSCPLKYSYRKQKKSFKNQVINTDKSFAIFSFINQTHVIDQTMTNQIFEQPQKILGDDKDKDFNDFSVIIKPVRLRGSNRTIQEKTEKSIGQADLEEY